MSILEARNAAYSYDGKKAVLKNVTVGFESGKIYAILGPSGCGKTTLLSLLGGLDSPTGGQILFDGEDILKRGLAFHRKNNVAFIFQNYNLIDYMTPAENVALTSKKPPLPILERLGLTREEAKRNVLRLSGGISNHMSADELMPILETLSYEVSSDTDDYTYYTVQEKDNYDWSINITVKKEDNTVTTIEFENR